MKLSKKIFCLLMIIVLTLGMTVGCQKNEEIKTVRLNEVVHSIFYAPQYVAINKGFFTDEGLKIELTTGQGADKTMAAVLTEQCDIGLAGPEASIYVLNQGKEDYAKIFAQLTKCDGSFLVGRTEEKDFKWENLKGKTIIGGRPGGVPEMTLEYTLKQHGLTPGVDVEVITNIQFTATTGAFVSGTGDYVSLFEPTASLLAANGSGYIVSSIGESSGQIPYTAYFASKNYLENNADTVQKFTNAIYKAQQWIATAPSTEIAALVKPFFPDSSEDVLTKVIDRYKSIGAWSTDPIMLEEDLTRLQTIMMDAKVIDKTADYGTLVDNSFAEKAMK